MSTDKLKDFENHYIALFNYHLRMIEETKDRMKELRVISDAWLWEHGILTAHMSYQARMEKIKEMLEEFFS